jgi:hypothetical protein
MNFPIVTNLLIQINELQLLLDAANSQLDQFQANATVSEVMAGNTGSDPPASPSARQRGSASDPTAPILLATPPCLKRNRPFLYDNSDLEEYKDNSQYLLEQLIASRMNYATIAHEYDKLKLVFHNNELLLNKQRLYIKYMKEQQQQSQQQAPPTQSMNEPPLPSQQHAPPQAQSYSSYILSGGRRPSASGNSATYAVERDRSASGSAYPPSSGIAATGGRHAAPSMVGGNSDLQEVSLDDDSSQAKGSTAASGGIAGLNRRKGTNTAAILNSGRKPSITGSSSAVKRPSHSMMPFSEIISIPRDIFSFSSSGGGLGNSNNNSSHQL